MRETVESIVVRWLETDMVDAGRVDDHTVVCIRGYDAKSNVTIASGPATCYTSSWTSDSAICWIAVAAPTPVVTPS